MGQDWKWNYTEPKITPTAITIKKGKGHPQQAEFAQGVLSRLMPQIFLTFGTTRVVGRQTYAPATFTPGDSLVLTFRG
jgi:hypothetical protein